MWFRCVRHFRLWNYNVSHNQLLVRSPISPEHDTNIDIVFWGVEYVELPSALYGFELMPPSREDNELVNRRLGAIGDVSSLFCIVSSDQRFLVVASGFKILENKLDVFESSLEYFAGTDENRDLGKVLCRSE